MHCLQDRFLAVKKVFKEKCVLKEKYAVLPLNVRTGFQFMAEISQNDQLYQKGSEFKWNINCLVKTVSLTCGKIYM